jgi:hypothetical protein
MAVVRRGFALVAWLVATAVSVGISTAAVGSVSNQVAERSDLVSLAALREATTTTTTIAMATTTTTLETMREASMSVVPTTIAPTTSTTSTTTTSVPAQAGAAAPTTTSPPDPSTTTSAPPDVQDLAVEQMTVEGGVVRVALADQSLQLIDALPEDGYRLEMGEWRDALIAVRFVGSDDLWHVVAELVDGRIRLTDRRTDGGHGESPGDGGDRSGDRDGAWADEGDGEDGDWKGHPDGDRERKTDGDDEGGGDVVDEEKDRRRQRPWHAADDGHHAEPSDTTETTLPGDSAP